MASIVAAIASSVTVEYIRHIQIRVHGARLNRQSVSAFRVGSEKRRFPALIVE
ncbi:hypothetical protein [Mesorhizobium sp. M1322]|uniref:hypothetical protein n=1 Tax=Mesorhizobium sp. M1322 TaxID=2957081 RepID=UPI003335A1B4